MRHLCQKVPIWGVYGAFRSAISSVLPLVVPEVQNFGTGRSIFGGLVPYILALETPNSGICIIHVGSKTWIFGGNGRAHSQYSRVLVFMLIVVCDELNYLTVFLLIFGRHIMFIMGHHGGMPDIVEIIEPHAANNEDRAMVSEK
jgi:hypothetical protein